MRDLTKKDDWLSSVDLKVAYLTFCSCIPRKTSMLHVGGEAQQMSVSSIGLASVPRVFLKILRPVMVTLRSQEIKYIDKILLLS